MSKFNPQLLETRAWDRYARATKHKNCSSEQKRTEALRLSDDISAINGLKSVIEWCENRRIEVYFTNRRAAGVYEIDRKSIYINSRQSLEKQLFVLLHECGHLLIDDRSEKTVFRFRHGYYVEDKEVKRKFIHRCAIVEEEFEAWHRGRKLATKLGININDEHFSAFKSRLLKSYMKWALRDPDFSPEDP
jgi:hypothetical protein